MFKVMIEAVETVRLRKIVEVTEDELAYLVNVVNAAGCDPLEADDLSLDPVLDIVDGSIDPMDVEIDIIQPNGKWKSALES